MFQETASNIVTYYMVGSLLLLVLVVAIVTYAFLHQKKVFRLRTQLHEEEINAQQARFDALQEGQEKERTRFAEELHDGIGAKLSGLRMNLEYLKSNAREHQALIEKVFSGVAEVAEEVRAISHNLQSYLFDGKDLEPQLLNYMEQLTLANGCRYDLLMNIPANSIPSAVKLQCFRIIAELLHNVHKHAKATLASVQINIEKDHLEIVVEDNGIGLYSKTGHKEGIGLANIRNRIRLYKGSIEVDASAGGTTVIIEIPLNTHS